VAVIYNVLTDVNKLALIPLDWQCDEKYNPKDLPSLWDLLEKHGGRTVGGSSVQQCSEKVRAQATELEDTMFALLQLPSCSTAAASSMLRLKMDVEGAVTPAQPAGC
jgi:hypothetical protein